MKKLLKILTCALLICLMAFTLTACGPDKGPDNGPGEGGGHTHEYTTVQDYYDQNNLELFAKTLKCSCGATTVKESIEITTAEELVSFSRYLENGLHYNYKVTIMNDIDMAGVAWESITIDVPDTRKVYEITGAGTGITIKNLSVSDGSYGGLFGEVITKLTVKNITIESANFNTAVAGGLIAEIDGCAEVKIINCGVKNSTIYGYQHAGGLYGMAISTDNNKMNISVTAPVITNNNISGEGYVGGLAGTATYCDRPDTDYVITVTVTDWTITGNVSRSTSESQNVTGCLFGYLGNGSVNVPEVTNEIMASNSAYLNDVKVEGREYGRTGWTSTATSGIYMNGIAMIKYGYNNVVNE